MNLWCICHEKLLCIKNLQHVSSFVYCNWIAICTKLSQLISELSIRHNPKQVKPVQILTTDFPEVHININIKLPPIFSWSLSYFYQNFVCFSYILQRTYMSSLLYNPLFLLSIHEEVPCYVIHSPGSHLSVSFQGPDVFLSIIFRHL
jgi:hypothetical protein